MNTHSTTQSARRAEAAEEGAGRDTDTARAAALLAELPAPWRVGARTARALVPAVAAALRTWSEPDLAAHLAANPGGVQAPAAVLRARLADLPPAPRVAADVASRPTWCGSCHEVTRMREDDDGRPSRCRACHPANVRTV